jgi:regulator of cell morphogenesis and NO signaling
MNPETTTLNEAIRLHPESLAVFKEYGLDTCCGGAATLAEAAARHGAPLDELLRALEGSHRGTEARR